MRIIPECPVRFFSDRFIRGNWFIGRLKHPPLRSLIRWLFRCRLIFWAFSQSVNFCKLISHGAEHDMIACRSIGRLLSLSYVLTRVRVCACQERKRETERKRERQPCAPDQSIISAGNKIWKNVIPRKVENAITLNRICNLHPISGGVASSADDHRRDRFDLRCGYHNRSAA